MTNKKSQLLESYGEEISKQIVENNSLDFSHVQTLLANVIMSSTSKSKIANYLNKSFIEKLIESIQVTLLNFIVSKSLN